MSEKKMRESYEPPTPDTSLRIYPRVLPQGWYFLFPQTRGRLKTDTAQK